MRIFVYALIFLTITGYLLIKPSIKLPESTKPTSIPISPTSIPPTLFFEVTPSPIASSSSQLKTRSIASPSIFKDDPYVCPTEEFVDCMPHPAEERMPYSGQPSQCKKAFLEWATKNCQGFKGAAY